MPHWPEVIAGSGVFLGVGAAALWGTFVPQSRLWCRNISRGRTDAMRIALTFDDGPTANCSDRVLDMLERERVPAAFFVIGRNVQDNPRLLQRMHAEGHLLGNHTFDHHHLSVFRGYRYWLDQLQRTHALIEEVAGVRPRFFRPPMGIKFAFAAAASRKMDYTMITWSRRGLDGLNTPSDEILRRLIDQCGAGDILTLHDGIDPHYRREPGMTLKALPELIDRLRGRGFTFVRVDKLIGERAYQDSPAATV